MCAPRCATPYSGNVDVYGYVSEGVAVSRRGGELMCGLGVPESFTLVCCKKGKARRIVALQLGGVLPLYRLNLLFGYYKTLKGCTSNCTSAMRKRGFGSSRVVKDDFRRTKAPGMEIFLKASRGRGGKPQLDDSFSSSLPRILVALGWLKKCAQSMLTLTSTTPFTK